MPKFAAHSPDTTPIDPRLERVLRRIVCLGLLAVLLLPAARGSSAWLGWMPLWLLAMPLSAWWALHRFALPRWPHPVAAQRRRRMRPQARRRSQPLRSAGGQLRAA